MRGVERRGPGRAVLAAAALALSACVGAEPARPAVDAFSVDYDSVWARTPLGGWQERDPSTLAADPLPFAARAKLGITVRAAVSAPSYEGFVTVSSRPGRVLAVESPTSEVVRASLLVRAGEETRAFVEVDQAFGDTRLHVEDIGLVPGPVSGAICDDGVDNDGDGRIDYPLDPGCAMRNDDSEAGGSHAVGVSEVIPFANPRLSDAQGCGPQPTLGRQTMTIDRGTLIVTAVFVDGFTVTDFAYLRGGCDPASGCCEGGRYAHMYAYNFNTPYGMRVCDRLASLTGTVLDFYGFTEMNFPSWRMYDVDQDPSNGLTLMRLPPSEITPELCPITVPQLTPDDVLSHSMMESWEAALVDIVDARLPADEDWVQCDLNGDADVAYNLRLDVCVPRELVRLPDAYCTTPDVCCEYECNTVCEERMCAELTSYRRYGQYPVGVGDGRVLLDTTNVPDFNPRALVRAGRTRVTRVTGVVREFAPLPFPWIIKPRCRQDIYIEGDDEFPDVPIHRRCVPSEETGDYEDPY